jgi:bifunctional ADP-heptose synthase (sugar kinase/adenylyltransferase)
MEDAIMYANRAAAVTVQHLGVYAPTLPEFDK